MAEKVAIVGSRDYKCPEKVIRYVLDLPRDTTIVSGGAKGPDSWAATTAHMLGMSTIIHHPDWYNRKSKTLSKRGIYNNRAAFERNSLIVRDADRIVAFWNGTSSGTADTIKKAKRAWKDVLVVGED